MSDKSSESKNLENLYDEKNIKKDYKPKWCKWLGFRHLQASLLFLCLAVNYLMRVNLSVAIVLMTNQQNNSETTGPPVFDWSIKQRSVLLSSFFFGYFVMNIIAAFLVSKFNNKKLLLFSVLLSSLVSIATPRIVKWLDFWSLLVIRISQGLMQGFMMPVVSGQLTRWIPPLEKGRLGAFVLGGLHVGTIVSYVTSGVLGGSAGGWPAIFYFSGGISLLWCFLWYEFGEQEPSQFKKISKQELTYIQTSIGNSLTSSPQNKRKIPWKLILTNKAVYGVAFATLCHNWGYWTLVTNMPTYFNSILKLEITNNGLISAMPYCSLWILSFPMSYITDLLITKNITSVTLSRKICNTIAHWGGAACLIFLGHTSNSVTAISMYTVAVTLMLFTFLGYNINLLDICPNYSGLLMGFINGIANLTSILGPLFVGIIVTDNENLMEWRIVFYVSAFIFFCGNLIFIIFGSAEVQKFNNLEKPEDHEESLNSINALS